MFIADRALGCARARALRASLFLVAILSIGLWLGRATTARAQADPPAGAQLAATPAPEESESRIEVLATPETKPTLPPTPAPDPRTRVATIGDTIFSIAAQTGFAVSDLALRNHLTRGDALLFGQVVRLPAPTTERLQLHRVVPGDTLTSIAAQYDVSPYALRRANRLGCFDCVFVWQWLRVPAGRAQGAKSGLAQVASALALPFVSVDVSPRAPHPGDVVVVRVKAARPLSSLTGALGDKPLRFVPDGGEASHAYIALSGIGALDEPGVRPLTLRAISSLGAAEVDGRMQVAPYSYGFENLVITKTLASLLDPRLNQQELDDMHAIFSQWTAGQLWSGPLQMPIKGRITSNFGAKRNFNGGVLRSYHSGMDISTPVSTTVRAMAAGRVVAVEKFPVRGNIVILDHGRGVMTAYCHLTKATAKVGDFVAVGAPIALSGNTGRTEGPHVHFELAVGGVVVDPREWLAKALP